MGSVVAMELLAPGWFRCVRCGVEQRRSGHHQKFCSACRDRAHQERVAAWREAHADAPSGGGPPTRVEWCAGQKDLAEQSLCRRALELEAAGAQRAADYEVPRSAVDAEYTAICWELEK